MEAREEGGRDVRQKKRSVIIWGFFALGLVQQAAIHTLASGLISAMNY